MPPPQDSSVTECLRTRSFGVRGLVADKAHKNHNTTETEKRIYFKFEDFWTEVDAATKVTKYKSDNQDV
ncbi:hypothetical protein CesoFtcFv8_015973 [Champsocephalus esox]|uniref:Uncharacterized protein n=1 Tax=Champsocephalus esox TaxID=159716 RepID=A0AAN8BLA8_9TELE|nr:hypothetical protein CesoFtcFv8_015973 [Champsocephalus esox]